MRCENCGSENPVVHLTQVVDKETRTLHLCRKCAEEKGVDKSSVPENFPLADLLAQMGREESLPERWSEIPPCSFCGLTFARFREAGRLGCPHCWSSFEPQLRGLLRRIHGRSQHVGKVYLSPDPSTSEREKLLDTLRRKLSRAVEFEDFEQAAELRDRIRELEPA
jgi:protein arginine kinase activator